MIKSSIKDENFFIDINSARRSDEDSIIIRGGRMHMMIIVIKSSDRQ